MQGSREDFQIETLQINKESFPIVWHIFLSLYALSLAFLSLSFLLLYYNSSFFFAC